MSLEKSEFKAAVINEVGNKLEDQFEFAKTAYAEAKGIRAGVELSFRHLEGMSTKLDTAFKDNAISEEEYKIAKKHFAEALKLFQSLLKTAGDQICNTQGRIAAMEHAVKLVGGMLKAEEGKITAFREGNLVEEGKGIPGSAPGDAEVVPLHRPEGQHPGNPIAGFHARKEPTPPAPPAPKKRGRPRKKE